MTLRFTILGCGSSGGVPRLGGHWGECDPANPKNARRRCSMLVERLGAAGTTRVLIDTGPDMRAQLLDAGVGELDAVVYTHSHADHIHGLDDLRQIVFNMGQRLPVFADPETAGRLVKAFDYAFVQPEDSNYKPICELTEIDGPFIIDGAGGQLPFTPFEVDHGNIKALGFRIGGPQGGLAYLPDVSDIPPLAWPYLQNLDIWVLDGLRRKPHPTHAHLALALEWMERAGNRHGVITNMHIDLDYDAVMRETPDHVVPAYDGMVLELPDA
ncbi:MBL fold metallo-hydrolase [Thioclava sp. GXIMD4216]|uniref:MBL fold metallo-hydrolase n=1 Tax=Thioclava sp. GXIMD4216 TaxID=3131929 RepID=UPI0030CA7985